MDEFKNAIGMSIYKSITNSIIMNNSVNYKNDVEDGNLQVDNYIPDWIFECLPAVLKNSCKQFVERRERDIFFTGALGVMSGCLPNTEGVYDRRKVFPNIFTFISAPPSSGKGVLRYAKKLGTKYHSSILGESREMRVEYEKKLAIYQKSLKKSKDFTEKPKEVTVKLLFIPADSSLPRIVQHLNMNDGVGIIFETEADSMSIAQSREWGNYSHLLRLAFHNESYSLSRKNKDEYVEIEIPKLSIVLTGTPSQIPKLIETIEDGLFSRFIFYTFNNNITWKDISINYTTSLDEEFDAFEEESFKITKFLQNSPKKIGLSSKQLNKLNGKFEVLLSDIVAEYGETASSIVFRFGLITYKICMILTAINKAEEGSLITEVECSDEDFNIAMSLSETYLHHSLSVFTTLPSRKENSRYNYKEKILSELPDEFERKDAVALAEKFNISVRTVDTMLSKDLGILIEKLSSGRYCKLCE